MTASSDQSKLRKLGFNPSDVDPADHAEIIRDQLTPDAYAERLRQREEALKASASVSQDGPSPLDLLLSLGSTIGTTLFPAQGQSVLPLAEDLRISGDWLLVPSGEKYLSPAAALSRPVRARSTLLVHEGRVALVFEANEIVAALSAGRHQLGTVPNRFIRVMRIDSVVLLFTRISVGANHLIAAARLTTPADLIGATDVWSHLEAALIKALGPHVTPLRRGAKASASVTTDQIDELLVEKPQLGPWKLEGAGWFGGTVIEDQPVPSKAVHGAPESRAEAGEAGQVFDPGREIEALRQRFGPGLVDTVAADAQAVGVRVRMPRQDLTITLIARPPRFAPEATLDGPGLRRVIVAYEADPDWAEFVAGVARGRA